MFKNILGGIFIIFLLGGCSTKYHCYKVANANGLKITNKQSYKK